MKNKRLLIERHQQHSIECDNPECDFTVPFSETVEKLLVRFINHPCPKCGENLLTEKDYLQALQLIKVVDWLNKWFSWPMYLIPQSKWDKRKSVSVKVHEGVKINRVD
jgi:hypothetical protein